MDEQSQKILNTILEKDPSELTPEDKAILKARWHYVGRSSREAFKFIFNEKPEETKPTPSQSEEDGENE